MNKYFTILASLIVFAMSQSIQTKSLGTVASSLPGENDKPSVAGALPDYPRYYKNLSLSNLSDQFEGVLYVEQWVPLKGFEGSYEISSFGRVKSLLRNYTNVLGRTYEQCERILKQDLGKYLRVTVCINGVTKRWSVHRLVGIHFIKNPENKPVINHKKGRRLNNAVYNLEWNTHSENTKDAFDNGFCDKKGEKASGSKLKEAQVMEIFKSKENSYIISKKYPISAKTVRDIRTGKSWSHLTGKEYKPTKK